MRFKKCSIVAIVGLTLVACSTPESDDKSKSSDPPDFISGEVLFNMYDGKSNDLLTAGTFNEDGALDDATFENAENPTMQELRILEIRSFYSTMMDPISPGGFGKFWGPSVHVDKAPDDLPTGRFGGKEYLAYSDDGSHKKNVKLLVQIPTTFDPTDPCIFLGPSSGSRGVYGAIGSTGDVALKRGCAVAYTDKGTGTGVHFLDDDQVFDINGQLKHKDDIGVASSFTAMNVDKSKFPYDTPVAFKHAHSQQNPEKDWGLNTLQSAKFALYVLNLDENYGKDFYFQPNNTLIIAASWSNGGRSVLMAAEQDTEGLIDGVISVEPSLSLDKSEFKITQGEQTWEQNSVGLSLFDMHAFQAVYQTCASLAPSNAGALWGNLHQPGMPYEIQAVNRCARLKTLGLLTNATSIDQAIEAQNKINTIAGVLKDQNITIPAFPTANSEVAIAYAYSYGKYPVDENLCDISFSAVTAMAPTGVPRALTAVEKATEFVGKNMIAGGGRLIQPVNNTAINGDGNTEPHHSYYSTDKDGNFDGNLTADLCTYAMSKPGKAELETAGLYDTYKYDENAYTRVQAGIAEADLNGNIQNIPTILIQGREDQIVGPNHGARAYFARNRQANSEANVVYWEVENGHHLEMFNFLTGFQTGTAYIHPYFEEAVEYLIKHIENDETIPPSQVIRTTTRDESGETEITETMFSSIKMTPGDDKISWDAATSTLIIPE